MTRTAVRTRGTLHWAVVLILCALVILPGCLGDDDDDKNKPPVAVAKADPDEAEVNYEIQFSGKSSSDPDGDSLDYQWDFDASDGDTDVDSTKKEPTHSYTEEGSYTVTLTVSDGELTAQDTVKVKVVKAQGYLIAKITTEDNTTGTITERDNDPDDVKENSIQVGFSGIDSEDTDESSEIEKYEWDYEFDGTFEADSSGVEGQHDYVSGRYTTMLQVTNTTGHTGRTSTLVTVNYNQTYNRTGDDEAQAGESQNFALPLNTVGAIKMEIELFYEVDDIGVDEDDLELYLYDAADNEIANTEDMENGTEMITIGYSDIYKNGLEGAIGDWRAQVRNENSVVDKEFKLFIDVYYFTP